MTTLKQAAKIERNLRRHAELMQELEAHGMSHLDASAVAYKLLMKEKIR